MRSSLQAGRTSCRSGLPQRQAFRSAAAPLCVRNRCRLVVRATADDDDEQLEKRLAKLRLAKGATPYGQGTKSAPTKEPFKEEKKEDAPVPRKKKEKVVYDYTDEVVHYEGPPHRGDLAVNVLFSATLFWIPLAIASIGRGLFVNYKFTNKRISVSTNAPWKTEQLDAAYQEVKEVRSVPRGIGAWGDMVVVLKDGSKIEMRALDRFRELGEYIIKRRDELSPAVAADLTQEELLGEPAKPTKAKGFA